MQVFPQVYSPFSQIWLFFYTHTLAPASQNIKLLVKYIQHGTTYIFLPVVEWLNLNTVIIQGAMYYWCIVISHKLFFELWNVAIAIAFQTNSGCFVLSLACVWQACHDDMRSALFHLTFVLVLFMIFKSFLLVHTIATTVNVKTVHAVFSMETSHLYRTAEIIGIFYDICILFIS